jgi:ankyrin repeat protein
MYYSYFGGFGDDFDRDAYRKKTPEEIEAEKKAAREKATKDLLKEMDCKGGRHPRSYMVAVLLKEGADPEATTEYGNRTPMSIAAGYNDIEVVKELVKGGAKYDVPDVYHHTPFQVAAGFGYLDLMKYLMKLGVDIHRPDENGETPLIRAVVPGCRVEAVKILLEAGARMEDADNSGKTVFDHCRERKDSYQNYGGTFNFDTRRCEGGRSAKEVYTEMERVLLDAWYEKFIRDGKPKLGAGWAVKILGAAVAQNDEKIAKAVLEAGADPDTPDIRGTTPLIAATRNGNVALMERLIAAGADINLPDANGTTPLMCSVSPYNNAALKCLMDRGAYIDPKDKNGMTALDLARNHFAWTSEVDGRPGDAIYEELKIEFEAVAKRQSIEEYQTGLRKPVSAGVKISLTKCTKPPPKPTALRLKKKDQAP